jgi:signal transduction histidine kinase
MITMGLPSRLALLTAGLAIVLVIGATEVALSWSGRSRLEDMRLESVALGNALAAYLARNAPTDDRAAIEQGLRDWSGRRNTQSRAWATLPGPDGPETVPSQTSGGRGILPDAADAAAISGGATVVHYHGGGDPGWHVAVPFGAPRPAAVADIQLSTRRLQDWARVERKRGYLAASVSALLVALGVALLTAYWVGRPLRAIGQAMAQAHGGVESAPAALETGPAEFRALAQAYNRLRQALAARERESAARAALLSLEEHARGLERLALVQQTASGLAHEIGTPLNTVNGHLQLLRDDLVAARQTDAAERVRMLLTQVERVVGILRAGLDRGTWPPPEVRPTDLHDVATRMLRFLEPAFADAGVVADESDLAAHREPARALCDPQLVEQILLNLLKNAIEALEPGQHVMVRAGAADGTAYVEVADDGPGLAEAARRQLFQPFSTTKGDAGTGLGLSVSRQLARALGGDLELLASGRGTRWRLTLPAAA